MTASVYIAPQTRTYDVAIIGGGATGVELAAELYNAASGLRHYGLEVFDESRLQITLLEAGPRLLPALPEKLADAVKEELEALGVRVLVNARVSEVTRDGVLTAAGETIPADLKVWAAGVKGADILHEIGDLETNRANQLEHEQSMAAPVAAPPMSIPMSRPAPPMVPPPAPSYAPPAGMAANDTNSAPLPAMGADGVNLQELARHAAMGAEKEAIQHALERFRWNRRKTAEYLQVSYKTLLNKMKECGISESPSA